MSGTGLSREVHNALTDETVRFIRTAEETGGELLVMEARWSKREHITPAHVHPGMEERWNVLEGRVGFRIGDDELVAGPGEWVTAPAGVLHENWNLGGGPALMRIEMRPPLRWEEFVRQLFALASEGLEGEEARRSVAEMLGEFAPEIELPPVS
jgi:mannose-6-phosphate isomerase-like protein (cupin superfamily)